MKNYNFGFLIILSVIVISCGMEKKRVVPDGGFGRYVLAYTSGIISVESSVRINLANPAADFNPSGEAISKKLFSFSPAIEGKAYWIDNTAIEFRPEKPLKSGTVYNGEFYLGELQKTESKFRKMPFQFSTISQSFSINFDGLKSYRDQQFDKMQMTGYLLTADVSDPEKVEKLVTARTDGKDMIFLWKHHDDRKQHFFTVDSIQRLKEDPVMISFFWNGKPMDLDIKGSRDFEVPSLSVFKVIEARVIQQPQQHISILFSDPVLGSQDLNGLITLDDGTDLRLIITGNEVKAWPGKSLSGSKQLTVFKGIKNILYYGLRETETFVISFQNLRPQVRLIGKGIIVPQGSSLVFPFEAVSLNAVDLRVVQIFKNNIQRFFQENQFGGDNELNRVGRLVYSGKIDLAKDHPDQLMQWSTYKVDIGNLLKLEQGAIYRIEIRFQKEYSLYTCTEPSIVETAEKDGETEETEEEMESEYYIESEPVENEKGYQTRWDTPGWYSDYYLPIGYKWQERDNPCHVSYYNSERFVNRNIFSSDLGIVAKEGRGHELVVAVTNLLTALPEQGVEIQLFNFQNQFMDKVGTDGNGFARINMKKKPFLLVAQKGQQFGYLRLDDGTSLSMSNFDVSGEVIQEGIKGFIYGERGVWRPGDTMFLTFIMEPGKVQLPENHPVIFSLFNPRGQLIEKRIETKGENGFYAFPVTTRSSDPTGNWRAEVQVGNSAFSKVLKIETVKPNRLKINLKIPELILPGNPSSIPMEASWLHGAPARSLKAKVDILFVKTQTYFNGFETYSFTNPASSFSPVEQTIFDGRLDENGKAAISTDLTNLKNAPGKVKGWFTSRVFEEGGDFSINVSSSVFAPFSRFVGIKMPKSEDNWYKTGTEYSPEIVIVNSDGKPAEGGSLEARLFKIDWRWWWESGTEELAYYASGNYSRPVATWKIDNAKHLNAIKLKVNYTNWQDNGRYMLLVTDKSGGHTTGTLFYMSEWGGWRPEGMEEGATMLSVNTDKKVYRTGEKIEVTLPSSKSGRALVSIENGSEITDIFWVKTEAQLTRFTIEAKPEMAPNVYIHISLIQPYGQTENDAPIRLYGVVPVLVENPETILEPVITMAEEIKPESAYTIKVAESSKKPMTYTLAVVDEGLLDLTSFRTPDPHSAFYAREALGVNTWDLYNYVAGAYGARLEKAFAVGGDEGLADKGKKQANRFVPVVQFDGPYSLRAGETREHKFDMPNYVGSVRIMVVSGIRGAYGNTEKTVKVRKALMLLATLPRVLAPGEEVSLPVSVFAMKEQVKNAEISIRTNEFFKVIGPDQATLQFSEPGEKIARFRLKVTTKTGIGKVDITASGGGEKATSSIELDIRNPNPPLTLEKSEIVEKGEKTGFSLPAPGMQGTNEAWFEVSSFPPLNLSKHLEFLIRYPHGCIEQAVSAAFPQLFLGKLTELSSEQKVRIDENIRKALSRLLQFQNANGGFGYWPGDYQSNDWATTYTGHFLLKAEAAGYSLPAGIKDRWVNYQRNQARNWRSSNGNNNGLYNQGYDLAQAYRLYTLALANSPDLGAMNRLRESVSKNQAAVWRLGAAYILAGQPEASRQITENLSVAVADYNEFSGTFGSGLRDQAMILESMILLGEEQKAFQLLRDIADKLNKEYSLSTQTAAWCLSSAALFADKFFGKSVELNFLLALGGKSENRRSVMPIVKIPAVFPASGPLAVEFENRGAASAFIRLVARGVPFRPDSTSASNNLKMEVRYYDSSGQPVIPAVLQQGEDLKMEVKVTHPGERTDYEEMVLSTVIPSGWEIMNRRLSDNPAAKNEFFDYQDIRDDRIYTYFDLKMNQSKTFTFWLNAAYAGKFCQPSVSCEAMYDHTVNAHTPGGWMEIKTSD